MNIDDLICELLEEPCAGEKGGVVFTSRSVELIHEIAEKCKTIPIVSSTQKQAEEYGHSLRREMCFLFTHGILHLLGYDHMTDEQEKEMFGLQDQILGALSIEREEA